MMADVDLTGGSTLVELVYNKDNEKAPIDPKELKEKLKKEKQEKKEAEKAREKERKEREKKEKEQRKAQQKEARSPKKVHLEHVRYPVSTQEPEEKERETEEEELRSEHEDEEGESKEHEKVAAAPLPPVDAAAAESGGRPRKRGGVHCPSCCLCLLLLLFLAALALSFFLSYHGMLRMHTEQPEVEEDGVKIVGAPLTSLEEEYADDDMEGRLPRSLEPLWYNVTLKLHLPGYIQLRKGRSRKFEGNLLAKFRVASATNLIVLHAAFLELPEIEGWKLLVEKEGKLVAANAQVHGISYNQTLEQLTLALSDELSAGEEFLLRVQYEGEMGSGKSGLYLSSYRTPDNHVRPLAVSDCEPAYARRILPLMDEPDRKAVFAVTVIHPAGSHALSNALENDTQQLEDPNWLSTSFLETPKMSSYLFTIVVSDYASLEANSTNGIPIRAWAPPHLVQQTEYALSIAVHMLDYYEKYFEIPYPLRKLDLVAVTDFSFSGMENWGIMTFEQGQLLYDANVSSILHRRSIAELVSHEVSHQWFGNLVTFKWWSDLWLSEAFATHAESVATARSGLMPDLSDLFYLTTQSDAFEADNYMEARPVSNPVHSVLDMETIFDDVTYNKGASIVRQLEDVMGQENFRRGIVAYLKKFAYGSASMKDLLETLQESLPEDKRKAVDIKTMTWRYARQGGYPIITVDRPDTKHVTLTESRNKLTGDKSEKAWNIPLFYRINGVDQPLEVFTTGLSLPVNESDLAIFNADSRGYYRVIYDPRGWDQITHELRHNHTRINALSRMRLISDAYEFSMKNFLPLEVALDMLDYLGQENNVIPLSKGLSLVQELRGRFGDEPDSVKVMEYAKDKMLPIYESRVDWDKLGNFSDDEISDALLSKEIIRWLVLDEYEDNSNRLYDLFTEKFTKPCDDDEGKKHVLPFECSGVPPLIREITYCEGIKRGGKKEFDLVVRLYLNAITNQEKDRLLRSLSCSQDTFRLRQLFHTLIDEPEKGLFKGRAVDEATLLDFSEQVARRVYNEFFYENFITIYTDYKFNPRLLSRLAEAVTVQTKMEIAELQSFMAAHAEAREFASLKRAIELGREEHVDWRRKHGRQLLEYLEKRKNRA